MRTWHLKIQAILNRLYRPALLIIDEHKFNILYYQLSVSKMARHHVGKARVLDCPECSYK